MRSTPLRRSNWATHLAALLLIAVASWLLLPRQAHAAITYFASASNPTDGSNLDLTAVPVTPPGSMQAGDLVILVANAREAGNTLTISATGGQSWTSETANTTNASQRIFWARYNGTWSANPSVAFPSSANGTSVAMHVFRPSSGSNTWALDVAETNSTFAAPSGLRDVTITGITTVTNGALVFATWVTTDNNTWGLQTAGWANAGGAQYRNGDGNDASQSSAYKVMATAGASGNVTNRQLTLGGDAGNSSILAFKEVVPTTTLATGTDPAAATIAPGAAATDVNTFTLQTSGGTEAVTSVTVNLSTASGVARLAITDNANTELGFTTAPATGANTISVAGLSASTTLTTFKVRVTPLSHAGMPAVPGAAYAITAPVTTWAGSYTHAGSDTNSNALTIDNQSPSGATVASGSAGNAQATLNWTTSASSDFSRSVVLRWTGSSAGAEAPVEGTDYANGNTIVGVATATVVCVRTADAASAAVSGVDGAGTGGCSATALTNGQAYSYKVFQKDSRGNYDAGVALGTFTPLAAAPTVVTSFSPTTIAANGTSTLTITITNSNSIAITSLAFTDTYASTNLKNATTPALANTCGGTATGTAGASSLSLSGGTLAGNSSCTVSVSVTSATAGSYANSTGTITSANAGSGASASAPTPLTVTVISAANSTVAASPTSVAADSSTTSTITVTLKDGASNGVAGKTVTLAAGSGSSVISPASGVTNASGVASFTVKNAVIEGPLTYTATDTTDSITVTQTAQVTFTTPPPVTCTSTGAGSGNWNLPATWTNCRGGIPIAGDSVTILNGHGVVLNITTPTLADLTNGGSLTASGTNTLIVGGNLINTGTISLGTSNADLYGNFTNNGGLSFNPGFTDSGTWTFKGTAVQNIYSSDVLTVFPKLTLNNNFGIALNASVTIKTLLTLTNGYISTGTNIISTLAACPAGVARTNGFVAGNLRLTFPSGTTTCTYAVGSGTIYAPISLTLTASSSGTTLTGSTAGNEHPQIATAGIDSTKDVNRYWSLWTTGDIGTAVTSYGATFTFVTGDLDIGATTGNFIVGKYVGGTWSLPTVGTAGATSTSITGVAGPITATTGFAVGEVGVADPPCTSPAGMTCVCDNFARSYLNPSTIFGANWAVGHSSGTFGDPSIVSNSLRLTDNSGNVSTVATLPGQFPAAGNTITVEFKHYAYGSTVRSTTSPCTAANPCGADGIALTLSDATVNPAAGAYGGSLGYAQKTGINGFAGGWLGVGIDEWGNFANPTEGRVGGPGFRPESVTLRGSGSGSGNASTNYPYLVTTGTIGASEIDNALSGSRSWGYLYRITVDASAYTWNGTTGTKTAKVKVERDTGAGYATLTNLNLPDIYTYNTGQADVPANWKLSFTGASGADTNIHEIRGLKICSTSYMPPAGFGILVDNLSPTTCNSQPVGQPVVTISARDSGGNVITNYTNTVTLSAKVSSPNGSSSATATWSKVTGNANGTLTGNQYTFVAADNGVAKFTLTDATAEDIYITVSENGGTLTSTLSTPIQYRGTAFTVATPDALGAGVVAGRNHLMSITRSNGCNTDTTYSGSKNLDGWYSIATGTHPAGADAPQICATSGGACLPATGSCTILSIAPPSLDASSNYLPSLSFSNGVANFCLVTSDVGNYSVNLRDDSNIAIPITGSSTTLAVRPFTVVVSNIKQGSTNNPATSDATSGTTPMIAGTAFQATVGGYLWKSTGVSNLGQGDTDGDGLPDSSATLAQLTNGGVVPSYADTVVLTTNTAAAANFAPTAPPATRGGLTGGTVAFTGGSATPTTLYYDEVGSFTLKATPSTNYLNAGVDLASRVVIFASSTARTSWVGRFRPDHFDFSAGTITNRSDINGGAGCSPASTFTYMGEPLRVGFTLTAKNAAGSTTQNYGKTDGSGASYAKFGNSVASWTNYNANDSFGLWAIASGYTYGGSTCKVVFSNAPPYTNTFQSCSSSTPALAISRAAGPRLTVSAATTPTWTSGVGTLGADAALQRADSPDGPYTSLSFGVAPQDSEGVKLQSFNLDTDNDTANERQLVGTTAVRFGILKLDNAYGSELLNIRVPVRAMYLQAAPGQFAVNTLDNCTSIPPASIAIDNQLGSLTSTKFGMAPTDHRPAAAVSLASGVGTLVFTRPSPTATGSADIALNLTGTTTDVSCNTTHPATTGAGLAWLQGKWGGSTACPSTVYDRDPSARLNFGASKAPYIYLRERY